MKPAFLRKLNKTFSSGFTLMVIPNSGAKKIQNCRIPFVLAMIILLFIAVNIYIFLGYSIQVWQIANFKQEIVTQNKTIAKLQVEKFLVQPVLAKNKLFETELNSYRQEFQQMNETWKRLRQKANFRFTLASRGVSHSNKTNSYILPLVSKTQAVTTSLDQLNNNLDHLKNILQKEKEAQERLFNDLKAYERHIDHTPSIWPAFAEIGSLFGFRFHPIYRRHIKHEGVDIKVEYGTKVRAAADGVISFSGWEGGYGYLVKINHDYGYETRYGHLSRLLVYPGQIVKKGQNIALSGNSGESTGPHLHYEVRINDNPVNPVSFMKD